MSKGRRSLTSAINARKSRGPVTPEGKLASAGNNLRHGILARAIILDDESEPRFNALAAEFYRQFQPRDFIETTMVDSLIANRWRQLRCWGMEKASISLEMRKQAPGLIGESKPTRAALAFRALTDQTRSLDVMNRYDARLERRFNRSLQRFQTLRKRENVNLPFDPNFHSPADPVDAPQTPTEQTI